MWIQSVKIRNFRGINEEREFLFQGKPFILLSAPNGLGKTSLIDAVEWCLTGNITRLKNAFDTRSTNNDERKKNVNGILKNKRASKNAEIEVILKIIDNDTEYIVRRVQKKDELNEKASEVTVNGKEGLAVEWLPQIADKNFYNFHYCDVQKSIEIQNRKRKDLPDLFLEFITDYTREISVASNLDFFADDTRRYIEDLEKEKVSNERIEILKSSIDEYGNTPEMQAYPETQIYKEENILISELDAEQLKKQMEILYKCGYEWAGTFLGEIIADDEARTAKKYLTDVANLLDTKEEQINNAISQGLHKGTQKIADIQQKINRLKELELSKDNIWNNTELLIALGNADFTEIKCNDAKEEIRKLENSLRDMEKEIKILSDGNEIIDSLTTLISKEHALKKYRSERLQNSEMAQCPVCGSERFGQIEEVQILSNARNYIDQHGQLIADKKKDKDKLESQIKISYESLIKVCNQVLAVAIKEEEKKRDDLKKLKETTEEFFITQRKLESMDSEKYNIEQLIVPGYIVSIENEMEKKFLDGVKVVQKREDYKKLLDLLDYQLSEGESEKAIFQKVRELSKDAPEAIGFSYSLLVQKINSINSILRNKKYLNLQKELETSKTTNRNISQKQKDLESLYDRAKKRADDIRRLVDCLKAEEYNIVGPNLYKFYRKLARINTIEGIQLKHEDEMLSIVDESDKNVVNILSNGQLSVFMLAYFFAGIVSRNKQELCKIYFIDDLTACMDDVNMLAFLDLMKYLMLEKDGTMDQVFFATCDERVCKLLRYKLKGCGVEFREITERDFA